MLWYGRMLQDGFREKIIPVLSKNLSISGGFFVSSHTLHSEFLNKKITLYMSPYCNVRSVSTMRGWFYFFNMLYLCSLHLYLYW